MASDLWEKLKTRFCYTDMENTEAENWVPLKESRNRLNSSKSLEQSEDWTYFEKYFAKDMHADTTGELRNRFLNELVRLLNNYLQSEHKRTSKVLDFHHPHQLKEIMEHCLKINKDPKSLEEVLSDCRETLKYCVKTGHPRFLNQLSTGLDIVGIAGEMLTSVADTNMFTYEVAPVFTLIEDIVLTKMLGYIGWYDGEGMFAPGGSISNLYGMLSARHKRFPSVKYSGMSSKGDIVVYTSEQSHFSINKAAMLLGIGLDNVIAVDCDSNGKMKVDVLRTKIKHSIANQKIPLMVNATCGTTILGAFDPLEKIADVCEEFGMWLHVDGAWGGGALLSDKHRYLLKGINRADSMTWNPHKMMGTPLQCSAILLKEKGVLLDVNQTGATYLYHKDKHYDTSFDTGDKSIQCGRHNDVFKLWLMWRSKGDNGFEDQIDLCFTLSKYLVSEIKKRPRFQLVLEEIEGPNICFWYIPSSIVITDEHDKGKTHLNKVAPSLKALMLEKGTIMVTYQPLGDLPNFFRIAISNPAIQKEDLDFVLNEIEELAKCL
ncbi:glutamate decarboxylase 1-like [Mytilus galloprovincialis]|uniref:glutamate decarboxylase 1-like n=1 Tax=Mytilus galloprovincialis TaxID=29158 RepID=UPI003F7C5697